MRGDLFQRLFVRFLAGLLAAFLVFLPFVHVFHAQTVLAEWQEDLRQEARWLAMHVRPEVIEKLAAAWRLTHGATRVTFFDGEGQVLADSSPERSLPDFDALRAGAADADRIAALAPLRDGGWLVMSRPSIPAFPSTLQWELVAAAAAIVALVAASLYPLVRSMRMTMKRLIGLAEDVSAGHFGKSLDDRRKDELGTLVAAFNDMSVRLAEAERLNTRLLHDVSHELRSPLGRIQAQAQTLALHPEEAAERVAGIEQEVALLDRLVGDLVQTARIEAETGTDAVTTFSLSAWAEETLRRLEPRVRSIGVGWHASLPAVDRSVRGDPQRLAQAVGNVVDNAVHALAGRDDGRVQVTVALADPDWTIDVADNGPGIPADDLPHVFRRFYRVDDHRARDHGGVGLGLSVVRAIVEAHGGTARIESETGRGTAVRLSIPIAGPTA